MIAPFLAALWVCYHTPSVWLSLPLLLLVGYSISTSLLWWWWILLQTLLGYLGCWFFYHILVRQQHPLRAVLKLPSLDAPFVMEVLTSIVAALCFALLYPERRSHGAPLLDYGILTATALLIAWYTVSHLARTLWFSASSHYALDKLLLEVTGWGAVADALYETQSLEGRLILVVLLAIRLVVWVIQFVMWE